MFSFHKKNLFIATLVLIATLSGNLASAAQGSLLNLLLGYPRIDTSPVGVCTYDQPTGALTISDKPTLVTFTSAGPLGFVVSGTLSLTANIDAAGNLLPGGTFALHGSVTTPGTGCASTCGDPLLTGTVSDYGIVDSSPAPGTDNADFRITPTGGSLLPLMPAGDQIGATVTLEGSTYSGTFASNWSCTGPKVVVGPTPPNQICGLTITKTAYPTTVGPITPPSGQECESDDDDDGISTTGLTCGCHGKVTSLTLQYNGINSSQILVNRISPAPMVLFQGTVAPGGQFTVSGPAGELAPGNGTLGSKITLSVNGGSTVEIHTSCLHPIGPGLVVGDFQVISGTSRKLTVPLCPIPVAGCPSNQQVTYTYTVTNINSPISNVVVSDDKLGVIGTIPSLGTGLSSTLIKSACLYQTTTNTVTASGSLSNGASCAALPASATVQLLPPPPPLPPTPPPPTAGNGCRNDYWRAGTHIQYWGGQHKPGEKFGKVFEVDAGGNRSLLMCLQDGAGSKAALNRQAVAALLNASSPTVNFAYTPNQVIQIVRDAYANGTIDATESLLESANNKSCPLPQ